MAKKNNAIIPTKVLPAEKRKYFDRVMGPREGSGFNQARTDGWMNMVTSIGTRADKRMHSELNWELRSPEFYEQAYAGGGIPARIVDLIPEHCLRQWVDWVNVKNVEKEEIAERSIELNLRGAFNNSWKWGRAYGGGCLHVVTDTSDPASPLRRGEKVLALRDLSRWDLRILTTDIEYDFGSTNFGHPRIYYLNLQMGSQYKGYPIHWTRMIRFDGQLVPRRTYIRNNYWHDSILNRIWNSIRNFEMAYDSAAACLQDFNVDVYKLNNVAAMMQAGKEDYVRDRVEMMAFTKSVINAMILDSKDEEYDNVGRSLEGVADMLDKVTSRLVADTDIPHTILLGESPDGSNATGNSTSQGWYNFLSSEQEHYAKPKMNRLADIIFPERTGMRPKFRPLRVLDEIEQSSVRKTHAETDQIYIEQGVLDPSEVTNSRFGGDEYGTDIKIDKEAREAGIIAPGAAEDLGEDPEGGDPAEGTGKEGKPKSTTGDKPPEGRDTGPSDDTERNNKPRPGAKDASLIGRGKESNDAEESAEIAFRAGTGESEFEFRNAIHSVKNAVPKDQSFISQTMSEPMRDPRTDPRIKGPGIPNKPRTILPTRGTGVTAPSGFDFVKDAGKSGVAREGLSTQGQDERGDSGIEATMKEFAKGTLTSGSGHKVTDPAQAAAIGYAEKRGDSVMRAATIIVKKDGKFLMGKRRDTGRWTLPGGVVERGESFHQGGIRELQEETGIQATKLRFMGGRVMEPEINKQVHLNIYEYAYDLERKPTGKLDPDKEMSVFRWIDLDKPLPDDISGNLQHPNNAALDLMGLLR